MHVPWRIELEIAVGGRGKSKRKAWGNKGKAREIQGKRAWEGCRGGVQKEAPARVELACTGIIFWIEDHYFCCATEVADLLSTVDAELEHCSNLVPCKQMPSPKGSAIT